MQRLYHAAWIAFLGPFALFIPDTRAYLAAPFRKGCSR